MDVVVCLSSTNTVREQVFEVEVPLDYHHHHHEGLFAAGATETHGALRRSEAVRVNGGVTKERKKEK